MTRVLRVLFAALGLACTFVAEALSDERSRALVCGLFPDDAEWTRFMSDPDGFPLLWVDTYGD